VHLDPEHPDSPVPGEAAHEAPSDVPAVPQTLIWRKHHATPGLPRVLLMIHYDTVYPPAEAPARGRADAAGSYVGPGAADAKGGIVVLLYALLALEQSPLAGRVAWTVALNPDEEIGSPGSAHTLIELAREHDVALVFEPAPSATHMAVARKGSGSFEAIFRGRSAHAGREIEKGRNAVLAAARFALDATAAVISIGHGATMNVGRITGGGPVNVVPDAAAVEFNVRAAAPEQAEAIERKLHDQIALACAADGISAELRGQFTSPPWVQSDAGRALFAALQMCGRELGLTLGGVSSGGASDANKIATAGIPVLDSLGPVGHQIHSPDERVELPTLVERAKLAAMLLMRIAAGEVKPGA
ncbi:MAG TPA: M20/M25/M40 family metallo-hydrolase, partial [Tepidisphaeraceae bacterium]|nr:M20/M25/M40 family metallo-hydrolase [Tepidisphaeraceae bacterium]